MKNLKKLMAVIVVVAMLATSLLTVGAAGNQYVVEAQHLYNMGLYNGVSTTSFDPDLESALNREQGVTMLVRMFGREADAKALSSAEVASILGAYSDAAKISDWARNSVALAIKEGLVQGRPDGTFGPADSLLGKDYATLILRALGYEVTATSYHTAAADLVEKGGLTASMALAFNDKPLIRDDFVGITFAALNAKDTTGMSIIAALVEAGVVGEDKAIAAGLYEEEKNLADAEEAVAALEAAVAKDLAVEANIKAAEGLIAGAKAAVAKTDSSALEAKLAAAEATVAAARKAFNDKVSLEDAAEKAVAALEAAAGKDLAVAANLTAAEKAVAPAEAAVAAVKDTTVNAALAARITAAKATVAAGKVYFDAKAAVDAYKVAPYTTLAEIEAAEALEAAANTAVAKVADAAKKAALEAEVAAQKALVVAAKVSLSTVEVVSVVTDNLKNVVITFSKEINKDTITTTTVKLSKGGGYTSLLSKDKKVLTLAMINAVNQSDSIKVTLDGLKDTDGNKMAKFEKSYNAVDVTAPVITGINYVNNKKIELIFSEPVTLDTAPNYKTTDSANLVNGVVKVDDNYAFAKFTAQPTKNIVAMEFLNSLADGNHNISVSDVKDFAGFKIVAATFNFNSSTDSVAPVAVKAEATAYNKVRVTFDEEVRLSGTFEIRQVGDVTTFETGATWALKDNNKAIEFTFAGANKFDIRSTIAWTVKYTNVEDVFGNKNTTAVTISGVPMVDDTDKPTVVTYATETGNALKVVFSEKVNAALTNFKLYKEDGTTKLADQATTVADYDTKNPDGMTYKVTFAALTNVDAATYQIEVKGVKDVSIRENEITAAKFSIVALDSKAPALVTAVQKWHASDAKLDKVELTFSEAMDANIAGTISNYFIGAAGAANIPVNTIKDAAIAISADGKKITLTIPNASTLGYNAIAMPALKDLTGNYISNASIGLPATIAATYTPLTVADLKFEATGKNAIKVTISKDGYTFNSADANNFKVVNRADHATSYELGIIAAQIAGDGKSVTLTTSVALEADAKLTTTSSVYSLDMYIAAGNTKDMNGNVITTVVSGVINYKALADKIKATQKAPVIKTVGNTVYSNSILMAFDEKVKYAATEIDATVLTTGIVIKDGSTVLTPVVDYNATINVDGVIEIVVKKNGIAKAELSVELAKPEFLKDLNGNNVKAIAAANVKDVSEKTAPTVSAAHVLDTNTVTYTFNEVMDSETITLANFAITGNNAASVSLSANGKVVTVIYTNTITAPTTVTINAADLAGNKPAAAVAIPNV